MRYRHFLHTVYEPLASFDVLIMASPPVAEEALSDDAMENFSQPHPVLLPPPELQNIRPIEGNIREASQTPTGRESLTRFLITEDYIRKLVPLVTVAERLEVLPDLHSLSAIMKQLILLNDSKIIEQMVSDGLILGVVGALECEDAFQRYC